jgi:hypothetical protein
MKITRTYFELPYHFEIKFECEVLINLNWNNQNVSLELDGMIIFEKMIVDTKQFKYIYDCDNYK